MIELPWIDGHADVWALFADAATLAECVERLVEPYRDKRVTHVAGVESRGFILGGAAARELGAGFVAIRKEGTGLLPGPKLHTTAKADCRGNRHQLRMQAHALPRGARVLIVDDWIETGSQLRAVRELVAAAGAGVAGVAVVVDQSTAPAPDLTALMRI